MKRKKNDFFKTALGNIAIAALILMISVCALSIVVLAENPSSTAVSHTPATSYSWYYKPRTDGEAPVCADNAPFVADYDNVIYLNKSGITLTFDTGYENGNTEAILNVLKEKAVTAAFFVTGHYVKTNPELVLRMKNEGHLVCNHTASHADLSVASKQKFSDETEKLSQMYEEITGEAMPKAVRPPEGKYSENFFKYAKEAGYKVVFWTFAYKDWINDEQPTPKEAMETMLSRTHDGMIALLHSNSATNAAVLGDVIDEWRKEGYTINDAACLLN